MLDINFSTIRAHNGKKDAAFEELICQLAHLNPPKNADYFVRKEGAGGDAGVECYWKLKDGTEHGWQAKYFLSPLKPTQWTQIEKSVKTAIEKHPLLKKYYICLPLNRTDIRKLKKGEKPTTLSLDEWEKNKNKWKEISEKKGLDIDFCYWGASEILSFLQRDTPEFAGRAHYWFDFPILTIDIFKQLADRSRDSLGERYTPDCHVELPIIKAINAVAMTKQWWQETENIIKLWNKNSEEIDKIIVMILEQFHDENLMNLKKEIQNFSSELSEDLIKKTFLLNLEKNKKTLEILLIKISKINDGLLKLNASEKKDDNQPYLHQKYYCFANETRNLYAYLNSLECKVASTRCMLLVGDGGIGKSHLLCDSAFARLENNLPTVFSLGQHYDGNNPLDLLKNDLDLNNLNNNNELLGALDAAGEANKTNLLIIIDAINEGSNSDGWKNHLRAFISRILKFPHLSLVLSCRSIYVDYLINESEHFTNDPLIKVKHMGFSGYENRAITQYFKNKGIAIPSVPIMSPEFSNPLFLKMCSNALKNSGKKNFPKGLQGITSIFGFYVDSMERIVKKRKNYLDSESVVRNALNTFARALFPDHLFGLPTKDARALINNCDPKNYSQNGSEDLFDIFIREGILSEDLSYCHTMKKCTRVIRFTYQRFSDYFIADAIEENLDKNSLKKSLSENFNRFIISDTFNYKVGVLTNLSIILAENFEKELVDFMPKKILVNEWFYNLIFTDTLQWRTAESFTTRTLELLNRIPKQGFHSRSLDVFLKLSTEPKHPWNADFLHQKLLSMTMPERDFYWSTHIAVSDDEESKDTKESPLRLLINWTCVDVIEQIEPERARLYATILIWVTSTSNKKVRDQATKAIIKMLIQYPLELEKIIEQFWQVNDLYVLERLYAVTYGVLCNIENQEVIKKIAKLVWERVFSSCQPIPHLLLRDYARGVLELAHSKRLLDSRIDPKSFRPPYNSLLPLVYPSNQEIESMQSIAPVIHFSVMYENDDFGNYTMNDVRNWSPTQVASNEAQTVGELLRNFSKDLPKTLKEKFLACLTIKQEIDSQPFDIKNLFERPLSLEFKQETGTKKELTEYESIIEQIEAILTSEKREEFHWLINEGDTNSVAKFCKKKAQKWVCKKAIELGWSNELFKDFEFDHIKDSFRSSGLIERIGKKYQWIALFEFISYLSDNCLYIDQGFDNVDYSKYFGPWQLHYRNIDPTLLLLKTQYDPWRRLTQKYWWRPYTYSFYGESLVGLKSWLKAKDSIPPFEELLKVKDENEFSWFVLSSFASWRKDAKYDKDNIPYQDAQYNIKACLISKESVNIFDQALSSHDFSGSPLLYERTTGNQGFLREYPWHPIYKDMSNWETDFSGFSEFSIKHLIPFVQYNGSFSGEDYLLNNSVIFYLPAKEIIEALNISQDLSECGKWVNSEKNIVFFDPSIMSDGDMPSALIRSDIFFDWLEKENLQLIWLISGEKRLFTENTAKSFGWQSYSGIYKLTEDGIKGSLNFNLKLPNNDN